MGDFCKCNMPGVYLKTVSRNVRTVHVEHVCSKCGAKMEKKYKDWIGKSVLEERGIDKAGLEIKKNYVPKDIMCEVKGCKNYGYDIHHWLPKECDKDNFSKWPVGRLCEEHHQEWHNLTETGNARRRNNVPD